MARERHPIADAPCDPDGTPWSDKRRIQYLECRLAQLWDEVWWHQLPFWRRWYYTLAEGHRSPIRNFYEPYVVTRDRARD